MAEALTDAELETLREFYDERLEGILDELVELEDAGGLHPAELEQLALEATGILREEEPPDGLVGLVVGAIEDLGDREGALLLGAAALVAPQVESAARAALGRLAEAGIAGELPAGTGELKAVEALRSRQSEGAGETYLLLLERPVAGGPEPELRWQLACVPLRDGAAPATAAGGAGVPCLYEGFLTPPREEPEARALIEAGEELDLVEVGLDEVADAIRAAADRNVELGLPIRWELGLALPAIGVALRGSAASFTGPRIIPEGHELYVDPEDDEHFARLSEAVLGDYVEYLEHSDERPPASELDDRRFIASQMLSWKWGYADGRLAHWLLDDLTELLLAHFPRKLDSDADSVASATAGVVEFTSFLERIHLLSGDTATDLASWCEELADDFAAAMADRSRWGPAKALVARMHEEGVEPDSQDAIDAWIEDFNSRPRAERDLGIGDSVDRSIAASLTGDPEAPVPWEIGGAIRARRASGGIAITWFPAGEYEAACERWEELTELWEGVDHAEYTRRMEATFRGWASHGHRPALVAVRIEEYVSWCEQQGENPAEARPAYAAEMDRAGLATAWPPGRNEPCWCGSGAKYKRCCGTVATTALHPLEATV